MTARRQLVINADDFGFTHDVNSGIVEAHRNGVLTATTLMANGAAFDDAVRLARENPALDIGCHLVLVQGESVAFPGTALPPTTNQLVRALALRRIRVHEELRAQVRKILDAGLAPTHLDTHKHTHLLPSVLDAVARVAAEFGILWVRRPVDFDAGSGHVPWKKRLVARAVAVAGARFSTVLAKHGCRTTDHFVGFQITGRFGTPELRPLLERLPAGTTEFMCHPGRCGDELRSARTRLKESREQELRALTDPETRSTLQAAGVELVTYRDLGV